MISHSLASWAVLLATTAAAAEPNLFFNWTFSPLSAGLEYGPSGMFVVNGTLPVWNATCSGDTFPLRGEDCIYAARSGAVNDSDPESVGPQLGAYTVGTDVWIFGETEAKTVLRAIDDQFLPTDFVPTGDLVMAATGMHPDVHRVYAEYQNSSVTVTKAIARLGITSDTDSLDDMRKRTESFVHYDGDRGNPSNYNETIDALSNNFFSGKIESTRVGGLVRVNETITFQAPDNTSFLIINGVCDDVGSTGQVTYDPPLSTSTQAGSYLYATTNVIVSDMLHYAVLDPTRVYNVSIQVGLVDHSQETLNETEAEAFYGRYTLFEDVTFYLLKDGSPPGKKGPGAGAIAGAVVGAVALVALLVGLLIWWKKRRNASADKFPTGSGVEQIDKCAPGEFEIDDGRTSDTQDPTVAPFPVSELSPDAHTPTASLVAAKMQREHLSQYGTDSGSEPSAYGSHVSPHEGSQGSYGRDSKHAGARMSRYPPEGSIPSGSHGHYHGRSSQRRIPGWMDEAPVVQESDAGVVPQNLVPPKYDPAWRQEAGSTASLLENDTAEAPGYERREESSSSSP